MLSAAKHLAPRGARRYAPGSGASVACAAEGARVFAGMMIASSALATVCAVLLVLGLRPRRRGDTPFCRACGYNPTGLDRTAAGVRCPECGADIAADAAIVRGTRHVRRGLIATGGIGLALGLAAVGGLLYGEHKRVDWYSHLPTALILRDARGSDATQALRALQVLHARLRVDELDAADVAALTEAALKWQPGALNDAPEGVEAAGILELLYDTDRLPPEQARRFFSNSFELRPLVRPKVVCSMEFPAGYEIVQNWQYNRCIELRDEQTLVDDTPLDLWNWPSNEYRRFTSAYSLASLSTPGIHEITIPVDIRVRPDKPWGIGDCDGPVLHTESRVVRSLVEAFAEETPELFRTLRSPELDEALAERLTLTPFTVVRRGADQSVFREWERDRMVAELEYGHEVPIGVAFSVTVCWDGREHPAREVSRSVGGRVAAQSIGVDRPAVPPESVTVVLRCSKAVAMMTPDIFEIWQGELHFDDVPVVEVDTPDEQDRPRRDATKRYHGRVVHCDSCGEAERSRWPAHPFAPPAPAKDLRTRLREWLARMQAHATSQPASAPTSQP